MGVNINMLKTLMWKNLIVRKRHWFMTILEAALPCLLIAVLLYVRFQIHTTPDSMNDKPYIPTPYNVSDCFQSPGHQGFNSRYIVAFSPNDDKIVNEIMMKTKNLLWKDKSVFTPQHASFMGSYLKELKAVANEHEMEQYFNELITNDTITLFYGIVFKEVSNKKFEYKIRIGNFLGDFSTDKLFPPLIPSVPGSEGGLYHSYCFLTLQKTLDSVYIETVTSKPVVQNQMFDEFPFPIVSRDDNEFQLVMSIVLPMIVIFSFSIILPNVIKRVVEEKETGVKELMKMMGLKSWMVWVGWLLNANMINIFVTTICTILLTGKFKDNIPPILPHTNPVLIWLLLILFMNAVTVYLFIFCAIFHRPLIASSVGMFFYYIPMIASSMSAVKSYMSYWVKIALCLVPTLGMSEGFNIIFAFNSRAVGAQFSNLFKSATDDKNDLSLGTVFVMLLLDICVYSIITWYIDNVRPGPYGRAKPWYFVFTSLCRKSNTSVIEDQDEDDDVTYFEQAPTHLRVGLSIRNLRKVFPPNLPAVNGVNLDIYKGQITALLGHNGAGKTTTMSILTGLYSPTSGAIHQHLTDSKCINVFDNMDKFREDLGLCPQHNMLFSYFTVIEHLMFFGQIKGMTMGKAKRDGLQLLVTLNMREKANVTVDKLSGGMKRKLSLAISLIASPKVLMLDEPTSGMDPESRREMWDILLNLREDRTIIITTHFMEEADVLGDRIAIMDHGKVRCYGTTMFLKKVYGAGYNMTLLTQPNADIAIITDLVINKVPGSKLRTYHQGQVVYNLPSESTSSFAALFAEIEKKKSNLKINSIGVSCTTMEEVFLKVGEICELEKNLEADKTSNNSQENNFSKSSSTEHLSPKRMTGLPLIYQQFHVLLLKKIKFTYRKKWSYIFFTILAMLMIGIAVRSSDSRDDTAPSINLGPDLYKETDVIITYDEKQVKYAEVYKSLFEDSSRVHLHPDENITSVLLDIGTKNIERYKLKFIVAADWTKDVITSLYSSIAIHSSPVSLNLVSNALLKFYKSDSSIITHNHPFVIESLGRCTTGGMSVDKYMVAIKWVMAVPFGMLFVVANFIAFPLEERINSAKHLQLMTGLSPVVYWFSCYVWDLTIFVVTSFLLLIPVLIFDHINMIKNMYEAGVFLAIMNSYGVSGITFAYFFSFLKKSSGGASSSFIFYNIIFGATGSLIVQILAALNILAETTHKLANGILMLNPYYCCAIAFYKFSMLAYEKAICKLCQLENNCFEDVSYFSFDDERNPYGVGFYMIIMILDWIFYFVLILLIDYGLMAKLFNYMKSVYVKEGNVRSLERDVQEEVDRVDAAKITQGVTSPVLMVDGLKKTYGRNFPAVKGVSFAVNSGECFGLLGVNGAGKTTTFKMLTGEEIPTAGNAAINGYTLKDNHSKYLAEIGYCPQFDAINELMTGQEMLNLFGLLRGISTEDTHILTNYWLRFLGLEEYSNRLCGTYSGGNKRKLSTAISLIGDPAIVFLDEPTSGVDPVARRKLWNVLARCQKGGQSIVLTSHSMDECEALCDRLTIMVQGQMVCIGNVLYLKQKYGQGFTIMVKLHSADRSDQMLKNLKRDIETTFAPSCVLNDEHKGLLHYHIKDSSKEWSFLFKSMDEIKTRHALVEDYTVSETTLEQVFISFAKQQRE